MRKKSVKIGPKNFCEISNLLKFLLNRTRGKYLKQQSLKTY